jgi:membrane protease YdiL (CAAX protease family)
MFNLELSTAFYGGTFLIFVFILFWREKPQTLTGFFSSIGFKRSGVKSSVAWSFALLPAFAVVGLASQFALSFLMPASSSSGVLGTTSQLQSWYYWFAIAQSFFPVAVFEEAFARGYLLDRLMPEHPSRLVKALPAVVLSSLLFTLWHLPSYLAGYHFSIPVVVGLLSLNVFPLSVLLSVAYVRAKTRNIAGLVAMHFLLDAGPVLMAIALTSH